MTSSSSDGVALSDENCFKAVGWEKDKDQKLRARVVSLGNSMDPKKYFLPLFSITYESNVNPLPSQTCGYSGRVELTANALALNACH